MVTFLLFLRSTAGVEGVALQADTVSLSNLSVKVDVPNYKEIKL